MYNDDIFVVLGEDFVPVESVEGKSGLKGSFFSWHLDAPGQVVSNFEEEKNEKEKVRTGSYLPCSTEVMNSPLSTTKSSLYHCDSGKEILP